MIPGVDMVEAADQNPESDTPKITDVIVGAADFSPTDKEEVADTGQPKVEVAEDIGDPSPHTVALRDFNREQRDGHVSTDFRPQVVSHVDQVKRTDDLLSGVQTVEVVDPGPVAVETVTKSPIPERHIRSGRTSIKVGPGGRVTARKTKKRTKKHPFLSRGERR